MFLDGGISRSGPLGGGSINKKKPRRSDGGTYLLAVLLGPFGGTYDEGGKSPINKKDYHLSDDSCKLFFTNKKPR